MTGASEKVLRRSQAALPDGLRSSGSTCRLLSWRRSHDDQTAVRSAVRPDLGSQAVGGAGVDKRIDILAVAIQAGMTVFDLEEMELAYAPQYGSAKDPINMAGFVAGGLLRGDHPRSTSRHWWQFRRQTSVAARCADAEEFAAGNIPAAVNIPVDELRSRLGELPRDREIVAYCQVGHWLSGNSDSMTSGSQRDEFERGLQDLHALATLVASSDRRSFDTLTFS